MSNILNILMAILSFLFPFINWGTTAPEDVETQAPVFNEVQQEIQRPVEAVPEIDIIEVGDTLEVAVPSGVKATVTLVATRGNVWELKIAAITSSETYLCYSDGEDMVLESLGSGTIEQIITVPAAACNYEIVVF